MPGEYAQFSEQEMAEIVALLQWMEACNARNVTDAFDPEIKKEIPVFFAAGTTGESNQPHLSSYHHAMRFVAAANKQFVEGEQTNKLAITAPSDFARFSKDRNYVAPTLTEDYQKLALANDIAETFNEFRKKGRFEDMEAAVDKGTDEQKKALAAINVSHDYALNLNAGPGGTLIKGVRRIVKVVLVAIGYPFIAFFGGGLSLIVSGLHTLGYGKEINLFKASMLTGKYSRYLVYSGIFSSVIDPPLGSKGFTYLQQAGLKEFGSWEDILSSWSKVDSFASGVNYFFTGLLSIPAIAAGFVAEGIVKILLFPFKWAFEYDQMSPVMQSRFDDLENMLVGFLMSPFLIVNYAYAALKRSVTNLFSAPQDDPMLIAWNSHSWVPDFLKLGHYNAENVFTTDLTKRPALAGFLKISHFIFDTLPDMFSRTLVNTLRSILPAVSFGGAVTKENRDTFWQYARQGTYSVVFIFQAVLLSWGIAIGAGAPGGAILGLIADKFAGGMGVAYIWLATHAWTISATVFSTVAAYFTTSHTLLGGLLHFNLTPAAAQILKVVGSIVGSIGATIAGFWGYNLYEQHKTNAKPGSIEAPNVPAVSTTELELKKFDNKADVVLKPAPVIMSTQPDPDAGKSPDTSEKTSGSSIVSTLHK